MRLVLLAHPSPPVLDGMASLLASRVPSVEVATADSGSACVTFARAHSPDGVVLDAETPCGEVGQVCQTLTDLGIPVVALVRDDPAQHLLFLEAGAQGIVPSTAGVETLVDAVVAALSGDAYIPPRMLGSLLRELIDRRRSDGGAAARIEALSPREHEVLALLGAGCDQHEIAEDLFISPNTAKTHINRVLGKLHLSSRIEAAALAVEQGITRQERTK